jgi:F-type H+-transporting ATPase subunit gamma
MATNKDLKLRIKSVKSTQKITKAMKMVAAAKLRKCRNKAEAAWPYAEKMALLLTNLAGNTSFEDNAPNLLVGNGKQDKHLIIVATSDRGLCGAFNSSIVRATKKLIQSLTNSGKSVKIFCIGKKGYEQLRPYYKQLIVDKVEGITKREISYSDAEAIAKKVLTAYEANEFDICTVIYNKFQSAIAQIVTEQQLIPLLENETNFERDLHPANQVNTSHEYEPSQELILQELLPKNFTVQIYHALLESAASEQGARMTAMDNATNSASDMIKGLTLIYNRSRQASITKELIEIISGAEAI